MCFKSTRIPTIMKNKPSLLVAGVTATMLFSLALAEAEPKAINGIDVNAKHLTADRRASKIIGMSVKNHQDEKLGSVDDLVVNLPRGSVTAMVISSGGFLGIGDELSMIPPEAFTRDEEGKLLKINTTKDRLLSAPHFQSSQWPDLNDQSYIDKLYESYSVVPRDKTNSGTESMIRASKILNLDVRNANNDDLGEVEELVLDETITKVIAVVISSGGFLGIGDELSVVPPQSISLNPDEKSVKLNATKETLMKAPRFNRDKWPDRMSDETYLNRINEPYRMNRPSDAADNTGVNKRDRDEAQPTPQDQGNDSRDLELTRKIRQEIVSRDELSFDAKNIKIITVDGKVTLRGPVSSTKEIEVIKSIAAKHAGADTVSTQLELKKDN